MAGEAELSVDIKNTGTKAGHLPQPLDRPKQELKDFQRITLAPGEQRSIFSL
jgi:hypothetical protein